MAVTHTAFFGFSDANGNDHCVLRNRATLLDLLHSSALANYTLVETIGAYQGNREAGVAVIVVSLDSREPNFDLNELTKVARLYKVKAEQDSVLITSRNEEAQLI